MLPSWNDVFQEMLAAGPPKGVAADLDGVRRQKMADVEAITGRPLVVYAVDIMNPTKTANNGLLSLLNFGDKDGFTEATRKIDGDNLDVLIQSLGGLAEAVESIVAMLRARFKHIRFIVPSIAKSAATMLALSGDEIVGGETSELGPIDPQMPTGRGSFAPAQAILDQFDSATKALKGDPSAMSAWLPILQQYGPSLLVECKNRQALSEKLVSSWLEQYMFHGEQDAAGRAAKVAQRLNAHNEWLTHGRRVSMKWLHDELGVKVLDLDANAALNEAVWGLHLAISITFTSSGAFKIVENSKGDALVGLAQLLNVQLMAQPIPQQPPQPPPQAPPAPPAPHDA
jgi:hypothetical protein